MNKFKFWLPFIVAFSIVLGVFLGSRLNFSSFPSSHGSKDLRERKMQQLIEFIDYEYVDEVNTDSLLDITIQELLPRLDPHSSYITLDEVKSTTESLQGNFEGIGIEFTSVGDTLTVLRVIKGGPSEKSGLKGGDRILVVDGDSLYGKQLSNGDYISRLKGSAGSTVEVDIYRPVDSSFKSISITRGKIPIPSVEVRQMVSERVGLIKLNRFAETTYDEFMTALIYLKSRGMEDLILDLRDNPGGLLYTSNKIAEEFMDKNQVIVYTVDRNNKKDITYAGKSGSFTQGEVVVLINENSASASEIVAGALQDNDRATIVGRRSFGKGLVQEEMELYDGSRVRLTTSRYYTPTGRSIQKSYTNGYADYQQESASRLDNGELFVEDSIKVNKEKKFITPKGKEVYGGGGIVPDVFVPVDTAQMEMLYHYIGLRTMDRFAFSEVDGNRKSYLSYSEAAFVEDFSVDHEMYLRYLKDITLENHAKLIDDDNAEYIKLRLKALLARNLFGMEAYYMVMNKVDPMVVKALEQFEIE